MITELNWLCRMHGIKSFVSSFVAPEGRIINGGKPLSAVRAWRLGIGASHNPFNPRAAAKRENIRRAIIKKITKVPFDGFVYDFCGCDNEAFFGGTTPVLLHNTNRPDVLDPALMRPGRFDRRVVLDLPDMKDREAILRIHSEGKTLDKGVDLHRVAMRTPGFSGADLANLMNEAAITTARRNKKIIGQDELFDAAEKVILGPERKSRVISDKEKEITAYHEGGHALVAASVKDADPIQKVSIISRGFAGGYTMKSPAEDQHLKTRNQFLADMAMMLGGYVSEKLTFGDVSTGASSDLKEASELARRLVTKYGMSDLGPVTFGGEEEMMFLGGSFGAERNYSERVASDIDEQVQKFVMRAYDTAEKVLRTQKPALKKIADTLIERETLEQDDFYALLKPFKIKPIAS
jgi:cell division protease FtsH